MGNQMMNGTKLRCSHTCYTFNSEQEQNNPSSSMDDSDMLYASERSQLKTLHAVLFHFCDMSDQTKL